MPAARKIKLSPKTREAARALAVRYCAFHRARDSNDDNGIAVWGELLLEAQALIGIELSDPECVNALVAAARRRRAGLRAA